MKEKLVIIGASITGIYAATELIRNDYKGNITIIDKKDVFPYNTYPLSKEWMMDLEDNSPPLLKKKEYYEENNIDLKLNTKVESVNWEEKKIVTNNKETIPYDYLLIATGSKLRKIDLPGDDAKGIFYLREFNDAMAIKEWVKDVKDVVIVGSGFIGLEFASTFSQLGKNVSVLVRSGRPLENILGEEVSKYFVEMHEAHGVKFLFDEETEEFVKDDEGKLSSVLTKTGKKNNADMVIIAIGVEPNLSFKLDSVETERKAIIVNEYGETSLPDIYAGGDIAIWPYKDKLIHIEHWETAWSQGTSIAKNILEKKSSKYEVDPYFWTDQYDHSFEYLGNARNWDKIFIRGSIKDGKFAIAYVDANDYPLAILFVNEIEKRKDIQKLLDRNEAIDEERFSNIDINIDDI